MFFDLLYQLDSFRSLEIFVMLMWGSYFVLCEELIVRFLLVCWVVFNMISVIVE